MGISIDMNTHIYKLYLSLPCSSNRLTGYVIVFLYRG